MPSNAGPSFDRRRVPRGLAIRDVITAIAVAGVLLSLASVSMPRFRSGAMLEECIDNQREIAAGSAAFALANNDYFAGLTWQQGNQTSQWNDLRLQAQNGGTSPHSAQLVDFLRRRGRLDIPVINSLFADNLYATVPLVDFLNKDVLDPFNICPGDVHRLNWRSNPAGFDAGLFLPYQPQGGNAQPINKRWAYSSSYLFTASAFDPLQSVFTTIAVQNRVNQNGQGHGNFTVPAFNNPLGPSPTSMVAYPSHKVFFSEAADRHFAATETYHSIAGATIAAAFFDGSVRVIDAQRGNPTWVPQFPSATVSTSYNYQPSIWEPLGGLPPGTLPPPLGTTQVKDPFRFTRDGLLGIDFPPLSRVRGARVGR